MTTPPEPTRTDITPTPEQLVDALTTLGVGVGADPNRPDGTYTDDRVAELAGALAHVVDGISAVITKGGVTTPQRSMWISGYLAAARGRTGPDVNDIAYIAVGTKTFASAEVVRSADPTNTTARVAADVLKLGGTLTMLAAALDQPHPDTDLTSDQVRAMIREAQHQVGQVRSMLGPLTRNLRRQGFTL